MCLQKQAHELHTGSIEILIDTSARVDPVETAHDMTNRYCADLPNNRMTNMLLPLITEPMLD